MAEGKGSQSETGKVRGVCIEEKMQRNEKKKEKQEKEQRYIYIVFKGINDKGRLEQQGKEGREVVKKKSFFSFFAQNQKYRQYNYVSL